MNKSDLIEALSKSENLTKTKAEEVVDLVFSEMTNALAAGDRVWVASFHRIVLLKSIQSP